MVGVIMKDGKGLNRKITSALHRREVKAEAEGPEETNFPNQNNYLL
jgi:hypothetical protein